METIIKKKINDVTYVGIILAKDWFKGMKYDRPVRDDDFVVCQWSDYHDGQKSNIEGKITLGICHELNHANLIYNSINSMSMELKVHTDIGILTAILVQDEKQGGYTAFFKEKEWDNLTTEGETIDESITNLLDLLNVVIKYKKDRGSVVNFVNWMWNYNVKRSNAVQGKWYQEDHGYIKDSEALYSVFIKELNRFNTPKESQEEDMNSNSWTQVPKGDGMKFWLNQYGLREWTINEPTVKSAMRSYYWVDRVIIMDENRKVLDDITFTEFIKTVSNGWVAVMPHPANEIKPQS